MICIYFSKLLILLQPESGNVNGGSSADAGGQARLQPVILSAMIQMESKFCAGNYKEEINMANIITDQAPAAVGPYVQGKTANGWCYVSGQLGLDPATGELRKDATSQLVQALTNAAAILAAAGLSKEDIVKVTLYITDMSAFQTLNEAYAEFFGASKPARTCVEVSALPKGGAVVVDVIAYDEGAQ